MSTENRNAATDATKSIYLYFSPSLAPKATSSRTQNECKAATAVSGVSVFRNYAKSLATSIRRTIANNILTASLSSLFIKAANTSRANKNASPTETYFVAS